jgi:ankyrin repeat protein
MALTALPRYGIALLCVCALLPGCRHGDPDVDDPLLDPWFFAADMGDVPKLQSLLASGKNIEAKDKQGRTALIYAVNGRRPAAAKFLVDHGADVNAKTNDGYTVFMNMVTYGDHGLAKLLIDHGANINAVASDGTSVLMVAARDVEIAQDLIDRGVDVNVVSKRGDTALLLAASENKLDICRSLIGKGAKVNVQDWYGYTPLMHAVQRDNPDLVRLMLTNGADITKRYDAERMYYGRGDTVPTEAERRRMREMEARPRKEDGQTVLDMAIEWKSSMVTLLTNFKRK